MKMKLFFLLMITAVITLGQNQKQNMLQEIKCTPPRFTGIEKAVPVLVEEKYMTIDEYIAKNVVYPDEDATYFNQGTEVIQFNVTPAGELADIKVVNSVSKSIDTEVIRVLKTTNGMWKPGYNDDKAVAMEKEISIVFKVGDGMNDFRTMGKKYYAKGSTALFMKESPKKALRNFDKGIVLLPNDCALLALRGLTKYEIGDKDGAVKDWTRIKSLGGFEGEHFLTSFTNMKGYAQMINVVEK